MAIVCLLVWKRHQAAGLAVAWLRGDLKSSTWVGFATVSYWGRLGKVLQFLAGLGVLVDLIGPHRLRDQARRLRQFQWSCVGLREATDPGSVLTVYLMMRASIFREIAAASAIDDPNPTIVAGTYATGTKAPQAPVRGPVTQDNMDAWHTETKRQLEDAHRCRRRHDDDGACQDQQHFVAQEITRFLRYHYGERSVDAVGDVESRLRQASHAAERAAFVAFGALLTVIVTCIVLYQTHLVPADSIVTKLEETIIVFAAAAGIVLLIVSMNPVDAVRLLQLRVVRLGVTAAAAAIAGLCRWVLEAVANALHAAPSLHGPDAVPSGAEVTHPAAEPGYRLRWTALALFVVGFALDFFAS